MAKQSSNGKAAGVGRSTWPYLVDADSCREKLGLMPPQIAVLIPTPHTLLDWVRSRACSKSSQMSGGKASSLAVMRFIAMRLAVFTTP